jgi:hypothetical protein
VSSAAHELHPQGRGRPASCLASSVSIAYGLRRVLRDRQLRSALIERSRRRSPQILSLCAEARAWRLAGISGHPEQLRRLRRPEGAAGGGSLCWAGSWPARGTLRYWADGRQRELSFAGGQAGQWRRFSGLHAELISRHLAASGRRCGSHHPRRHRRCHGQSTSQNGGYHALRASLPSICCLSGSGLSVAPSTYQPDLPRQCQGAQNHLLAGLIVVVPVARGSRRGQVEPGRPGRSPRARVRRIAMCCPAATVTQAPGRAGNPLRSGPRHDR